MQAKKVSILIPLYNAEKYIEDTIKSALEQTYTNIEIIIVDDSSTDDSYKIAKKYESSTVFVTRQKNKGPGAARNKAFELSSGEYIQYLDADDLMEPQKIEVQLGLLEKYGCDTFVFGHVGEFHQSIQNIRYSPAKYHKNYDNNIQFISDYWGCGGMIQIASCLIPRKKILEVGAWNEDWILNEDGEFISRIIFQCKQIIYSKQSFVYYRKDNKFSLNSQRTRKHYESHLASYNSYFVLVQSHLENKMIVLALAKRYSRLIYMMYPQYQDLRLIAEQRLTELGFNGPVPLGRISFAVAVYIVGAQKALEVREYIRKVVNVIRAY